jgi:hypothetical protein
MDDESKNHAKFLILSHLIFVCKYRKKLLIPYGNETKQIFLRHCIRVSIFHRADGSRSSSYPLLSQKRASNITARHRAKVETGIDLATLEDLQYQFAKTFLERENILE